MDEAKLEEIRQWFGKAYRDLRSGERLLAGDPPFRDTAAYHCQQAAEKALKAYLTFHDAPFQKIHDLSMLLEECRVFDPAFEQLREHAETLTPYGTAFRYPGEAEDPESEEAQEAVRLAEAVLEFVRTRIPEDTRKSIHE